MNTELREALELLEKEKGIPRQALLEAIASSLQQACRNHFGSADNVRVNIDPETCEYSVIADKVVVEKVENPVSEISLGDARLIDPQYQLDDIVQVPINSKSFGRIATQNAKGVIVQRIREEERRILYNEFFSMERKVVEGTVERDNGRSVIINLGKADGYLSENEQVRGERLQPNEKVKVYVVEVRDTPRGPRVMVSRTHPELVRRLFEEEVSEVRENIVEIKAISREAGSRTKMAVESHNPDVDAVGACVGLNGNRVNAVVEELRGEKIDIISYDENPAYLIENALSPAKVIAVIADQDNKDALVIVPDTQLSLAIGKEGQNARLAAKLTGYKIDIKSESQAQEQGLFDDMGIDYHGEEDEEEYEYDEDEEEYEEDGYSESSSDLTEDGQALETEAASDYSDSAEGDEADASPESIDASPEGMESAETGEYPEIDAENAADDREGEKHE